LVALKGLMTPTDSQLVLARTKLPAQGNLVPRTATTVNEIEQTKRESHGTSQFSFRGLFAVTAVFALWIFLLSDFRHEPIATTFFWTTAVVAGVVGHLIYRYLLPWRGTVVIGLLVIPFLVFTVLETVLSGGDAVLDVLWLPIDLFRHQSWADSLRSSIPVFICTVVLTAAHPVRPSLTSAIISAIGVSLWYGMAILIAANAG
jgi:hypothetical protein